MSSISALESALERARSANDTYVITIETDPRNPPDVGGAWWDVAIAEVSERAEVVDARRAYEVHKARQKQNL